tara:strand:+ start:191 stop:679 length:489 start_codon:yes stop_codon:yes gene_type:complete
MSNFNYQEYLRNNPLLKEEIKDQLITESQEVEVDEDARTDAEQEGYKDGFDDAKDDVKSALTKMKVSELKAKIKEQILAELSLSEADEDEEEVDVEDKIEIDDEVFDVEEPTEQGGLSQDEQEIQNSLKLAYDNAIAIGDQKLADQIGNSITFFTRTHVVER